MSRAAPAVAVLVLLASLTTGTVGAGDPLDGDHDAGHVAPAFPGAVVERPAAGADAGADHTVRVGVIGGRFDADHPALDGQVAAHARLTGAALSPGAVGGASHDTAVAEIVADRTEDAGLYLVGVGSRPTPETYERAVAWLLANEVDVIVDSGSYFPSTAGGMDQISATAARAADRGAVFVTSAGNYAERHWRGQPTDIGWVDFGEGTQGNRLGEGAVSGEVTLRLYWDGAADYDLYLYRDLPGSDDPVVAKSTREAGNAEAIDASLATGHYYVAVYTRTPGDGPVDLFAAERSLAVTGGGGSAVAPAGAEGVIAVGAVDQAGTVRAYSSDSADVSADGTAETTVAGRFEGTSAAAPLVGGAVAELRRTGEFTPEEVETILRRTADGDGREIDPDEALIAAANATTADGPGATPAGGQSQSGAAPGEQNASAAEAGTGP